MSSNRMILATAYFNGQPTRKSQSITSSADSKDEFLRQVHAEREKREVERRRNEAAIKLQSFWRRYLCRRRQRTQFREDFDTLLKSGQSGAILEQAIRRLVVFFSPEIDSDRLLSLCQKMVTSFGAGARYPASLVRLLLTRCLQYLKYAAPKGSNVSIAMPFRCLEVFVLDGPDESQEDQWSKLILISGLVKQGYYEVMRHLFDHRTPASDMTEENPQAPTATAKSFMQAVIKPLLLLQRVAANVAPGSAELHFDEMRYTIWRALISNFFAKSPMTPIIRFYVLPYFVELNKVVVLEDLGKYASNSYDSLAHANLWTPEFAYTLAYFLTKMTADTAGNNFIETYSKASVSLLENVPQRSALASDEDEEHEATTAEQSEPMDVDKPQSAGTWLVEEWVQLNHYEKVVAYLTGLVNAASDAPDDPSMSALIELCRVHWSLEHFNAHNCRFLKRLAFQPKLIQRLWKSILTCSSPSLLGCRRSLLEQLQKGCQLGIEDRRRIVPLLSVFSALFTTALSTANDEDFFPEMSLEPQGDTMLLSRSSLASLSSNLRDVALGLIELALPDSRPTVSEQYRAALTTMGADFSRSDTREWNQLFDVVVRLLQLLHDRDERLQFCPIGSWSVRNRVTFQHMRLFRSTGAGARGRRLFNIPRYLNRQQLAEAGPFVQSAAEQRDMTIMRRIPFVVPFEQRVELLYQLISNDQREHGVDGNWRQGVSVNARRNFLYEDAFDQLSVTNVGDLRQVVRVKLKNWAGAVEAGVDGGGLFREFLNELLKTGFDPQRGFFIATRHDSALYPNPLAPKLFPEGEYRRHYYFLGRMVGKLIYENLLAELRFSRFFLSGLLRFDCGSVDVHQLFYYDPVLYKNVMRLKNEDDVSSLGLDFSVVVEEFGEVQRFDLKPDGLNIPVTNENRQEFIQLLAEFYMRRQIKFQTDAFRDGLANIIDLDWLQMFDYRELQVLISGADRPIDVDDLRQNTGFGGDVRKVGDNIADDYVELFWQVVRSFNEDQKKKLLKFVTSCSRPPLLGFKDLHPPFGVQIYNLREGEQERLPSSMTCCNLLKLPRFQDAAVLKDKLLYAIEAGAGFELS